MSDLFKVSNRFAHLNPSQSLGDGIAAGFSSINHRGKIWSLRHGGKTYYFKRADDGSALTFLDVVIVSINPFTSKVYFPPGEWDESSAGGPLCGSLKGDVPDAGVPVPQAKACGVCPNNEWINKPGGGRGKHCQDHKRMAVLLMPEMTTRMLGSPLETPVFFKVPPGSLRPLKNYGDSLAHRGIPFQSVITRISFTPDKLFEMKFEEIRTLTDEEADPVLSAIEAPQTLQIVGTGGTTPRLAAPQAQAAPRTMTTGYASPAGTPPVQATAYPAPGPSPETAPVKRRARKSNGVTAELPLQAPAPVRAAPAPAQAVPSHEGQDWEEADDDLDAKVSDLLSRKIQGMMK